MCIIKKNWKEKAVERTKELKNLRRKNKDLESSRDKWKEKAEKYKDKYETEISNSKKN